MFRVFSFHRMSAWMKCHPLIYAWGLETRARLECWRIGSRTSDAGIRIAVALVAISWALFVAVRYGPFLLQKASMHPVSTAILFALATSVWVHRARQWWQAIYARGWLATLPVSRSASLGIVVARSLAWPAIAWLMMSVTTLGMALFSARPMAVGLLLSVCAAGVVGGAMVGWWLPHRETSVPRPASQRAAVAPVSSQPALTGLSYWPISQTRVWLQPRSIARLLLPVMLILPQNMPGNLAIAVLALCILGSYLSVLLWATARVARESATWLRPTPLPLIRYCWAVLRRAVLKQVQWTLLGAMLLTAVGVDAIMAIRIAEGWLAIVSVVSSVAATQAYYSNTARFKIAVTLRALGAIEHFRQRLALPCALLFSAWQFKRAKRA